MHTTIKQFFLPEDTSVEVIDLSGLCMPQGEFLPKDFDRYTNLRKIILHGCDKDTVAYVMIQCAYIFGRQITFEADFDWKRDKALLLEPGVYGQEVSLPLSWDFGHHDDFCFQVYGDECYCNSFKEVIAEGNDICLVVYSPICCRIGDTFDIAISANQGSWHYHDYATLLLQEVVMQWDSVAIVRVKVLHIGTYKDHLKHAVVAPERYAYSPPETGDEPAQACHYDVGEGIIVVYASSGGGDQWEEHHIMTIDGIDHLVCIEYRDYGLHAVVFGDLVLGRHSMAPSLTQKTKHTRSMYIEQSENQEL